MRFPILTLLAALFLVGGLTGCDPIGKGEPWPPSYGVAERASHEQESTFVRRNWRDAIRFPKTSGTQVIDLGEIGDARAVRLGLLLKSTKSIQDGVRVYINREEVAVVPMLRAILWNELLLDFGDPDRFESTDRCRVAFDVDDEFWVAPLELIDPSVDQPNVLVFLVDTLRTENCSLYGYERKTTPHLDRFAQDATVFDNMLSVSSWTRPSVASMLSGTYPSTHGARGYTDVMRSDVPRIADLLEEEGYRTYAYARNANVHPYWGIGTEFFNYGFYGMGQGDANVMRTLYRTFPALKGQKWFMYVHLLDPHGAYRPPTALYGRYEGEPRAAYPNKILDRMLGDDVAYKNYAREGFGFTDEQFDKAKALKEGTDYVAEPIGDLVRESVDLYDSEINVSDDYFQETLDILEESGQLDNTIIVFLSDHGEEFYEHDGWWHGKTLYEEVVRVPLIVRKPGGNDGVGRVANMVQTVDIMPTILDLLDVEIPEAIEGESLEPLMKGEEREPRVGFTSLNHRSGKPKNMSAAILGDSKVIVDHIEDTYTWYDLATDPGEQAPLAEPPAESEKMLARIDAVRFRAQAGLHLIFTSPLLEGEEDVYEGTITIPGMRSYELRYPAERVTTSREGDTITFRIEMSSADVMFDNHFATHAELYVDADVGVSGTLALTLNGESVAGMQVPTSEDPKMVAIGDSAPMAFGDLLAPAAKANIALVPIDGGVYGWFIPPATEIGIDEMDDEMRETLEGLGYL